jgi:hypothetical protein
VRQHIEAVVSRGFSRALTTLETDVVDPLTSGMLTLSAKLSNLEDEKLLSRLIEIWILFYDQVLPYVEGVSYSLTDYSCPSRDLAFCKVFLPVHTDNLIVSLNRPKLNRAASPPLGETPLRNHSTQYIDVRTLTLRAFRDKVLTPFHARLVNLLSPSRRNLFHENVEHSQSRLRQMYVCNSFYLAFSCANVKTGYLFLSRLDGLYHVTLLCSRRSKENRPCCNYTGP